MVTKQNFTIMPRGKAVVSGKWNFHVKRILCPDCNRKGRYLTRLGYACMYKNCTGEAYINNITQPNQKSK